MKRKILSSIALSGMLMSSASAWDMLIADKVENTDITGLWFKFGTGGDYRNAFSTNFNAGGFDGFPIYKEKEHGFALGEQYPTLNRLNILIRNKPLERITNEEVPTGDAGGVGSREYFSYRIDNVTRTGWVSFGKYKKDGTHGLPFQDPVLWLKAGDKLTIGSVDNLNDGIVIDYKRVNENNDMVQRIIAADTVAKFEIRGDFVGNIRTQHNDGPANNTTDGMGYDEITDLPRVPLVTWGNVTGTISSIMNFDTKTAEISMVKYEGEYTEVVDHYMMNYTRPNELMNRWVISGDFTSTVKNPLKFISKDHSSTYLEFAGAYKGGQGLAIASEGSTMEDGRRKTITLVKARNQIEIGEIYALKQGSIYMDLDKGAKIHKLGFGSEYDGKTFDTGYGQQGGLISMNVKSGTVSVENDVVADGELFYANRNIAMFDTSGVNGGVTFDIKGELKNASWLFSVGKNTKVKLGGQYNYIATLRDNGGVSMLHKGQNVNVEIDKNQTKQSMIWFGDREQDNFKNLNTLIGLDRSVVDGGLTIETNINKLSNGKYTPDLVIVRNMLIKRNPENGATINLIPRTKSENNFRDHVGKVVGYTTSGEYGTVDFTKVTTWKPTDGILNGYFEIELEGKNYGYDNQYKEWKILRYDYKGGTLPPEPEKPDPEPEKPSKDESFGGYDPDGDIGFNPGLEEGPIEKPEPPKPDPEPEPTPPDPDPNPNPNPPVEPDKPVNPDPVPPVDGGDNNGGTKPPVTPPDNGGNEKPEEKPDVPSTNGPFTQTFVKSMTKSTQTMKNLYLATFNSMNKRLGELRDSHNQHGVWGRVFAGAYNDDIFWSLQVGYDNLVITKPNLNVYAGAAASYAKDEYTDLGEFVGYVSMVQDNGFYNDALFKFSIMNSKTDVAKVMHYGVTVSDEVGYRFRFAEFFIDPQVEFSLGYLTGGQFDSLYNGSRVNVKFSDTIHFRARYGVAAGYDYVHKDKAKVQAYLGVYGETDKFSKASGNGSTLGAYGFRQEFAGAYTDDTRMVLNLGTNVDMKDAGKIYFDFEKSFLGDFNIDWKVNIGFRYSFGEKIKLQPRAVNDDPTEKVEKKEEKKKEATPLALKKSEAKKTKSNTSKKVAKKSSKPKTLADAVEKQIAKLSKK